MKQTDIFKPEQITEWYGYTAQSTEYTHNPRQGEILYFISGIQRQDGGHHQMNGGDNNNGDKNKCLHTRQS